MGKIFFTSDTHAWHTNIMKFCPESRLGKDSYEMTNILIENWNSQVEDEDTVYHLGDVSFGSEQMVNKFLYSIKGKIILIKGNHDRGCLTPGNVKRFDSVHDYLKVTIDGHQVIMFHYPIAEWDQMHRGSFHTFGHVHGTKKMPGRSLDVGIDARPHKDMKLWEWDEVKKILLTKEILSHH